MKRHIDIKFFNLDINTFISFIEERKGEIYFNKNKIYGLALPIPVSDGGIQFIGEYNESSREMEQNFTIYTSPVSRQQMLETLIDLFDNFEVSARTTFSILFLFKNFGQHNHRFSYYFDDKIDFTLIVPIHHQQKVYDYIQQQGKATLTKVNGFSMFSPMLLILDEITYSMEKLICWDISTEFSEIQNLVKFIVDNEIDNIFFSSFNYLFIEKNDLSIIDIKYFEYY